jgi:hypothetical protein
VLTERVSRPRSAVSSLANLAIGACGRAGYRCCHSAWGCQVFRWERDIQGVALSCGTC